METTTFFFISILALIVYIVIARLVIYYSVKQALNESLMEAKKANKLLEGILENAGGEANTGEDYSKMPLYIDLAKRKIKPQ